MKELAEKPIEQNDPQVAKPQMNSTTPPDSAKTQGEYTTLLE